MAKKEKITKEKFNNKQETLDLKEFMLLDGKKQDAEIKKILNYMYDEKVDISQKHIDKVLNVAFDPKDNEVYLPHSLKVEKKGNKLEFSFKKNNNLGLLILFALTFLFIGGFATFTGVKYLSKAELNQDLDGDGIADLNIDINNDGICDINCDTNKDGKPDKNIDYHGNHKPIFNYLTESDEIKNPINIDKDSDGTCDINCDTNADGWPDVNIDYDGDGKIDFDRDIDGDGVKDLDIDLRGKGQCDLNCDDNKDNKCDRNCSNVAITNNGNGTSSSSGSGGLEVDTADLLTIFEASDDVIVSNLYPDDQPETDVNKTVPDMKFKIQNTTDKVLYYTIDWEDVTSTFTSDNFWFRVKSDNNGYRQGWAPTPKKDGSMTTTTVAIEPHVTQSYVVAFTLHGIGAAQNYDQGKNFKAKIRVNLSENQ